MTVQQLCEQFHVQSKEDLTSAWTCYVTNAKSNDEAEQNAALLDFLQEYFSIMDSKKFRHQEAALNFILIQINALLKQHGEQVIVSKVKKTRRKAVRAAISSMTMKMDFNFPENIRLVEQSDGTFLCEITCSVFYSEKMGEMAMQFVDENRFDQPHLAKLYAAKCQNLNAYFNLGNYFKDSRLAHIVSQDLYYYNFPDLKVKAKYPNKTDIYTLHPNSALYWYYLGAEKGGITCSYEAAKLFLENKAYPLCAKYMQNLSTFDNDYRDEAAWTLLELLATQIIDTSVVNTLQKNELYNYLIRKYPKSIPQKVSKNAIRLLANYAYQQKEYQTALRFYRYSGVTTASACSDFEIARRMGIILRETGNRIEALEWLLKFEYIQPPGSSHEIASIYLEKWQRDNNPADAKGAMKYFEKCTPTSTEAAILLKLHLRKIINLDQERLKSYASISIPVLDAVVASEIGIQIWENNQHVASDICIALMRRAVEQDRENGKRWFNLGYMSAYETLYGEGFSTQKLEGAKKHFETALQYGYTPALIHLSDCFWSQKKEGYPQDFQKAKELLQKYLQNGDPANFYSVYTRLATISILEKKPINIVVEYWGKAHQLKPQNDIAAQFHRRYGSWLNEYLRLLPEGDTLQQEVEQLFGNYADFMYAIATHQELAGNKRTAIALYGSSAAKGNKKALYTLFNMTKPGTNYFNQ